MIAFHSSIQEYQSIQSIRGLESRGCIKVHIARILRLRNKFPVPRPHDVPAWWHSLVLESLALPFSVGFGPMRFAHNEESASAFRLSRYFQRLENDSDSFKPPDMGKQDRASRIRLLCRGLPLVGFPDLWANTLEFRMRIVQSLHHDLFPGVIANFKQFANHRFKQLI